MERKIGIGPHKVSDDVSMEERNGYPMIVLRDNKGEVRLYPLTPAEAVGVEAWLSEWRETQVNLSGGRIR